MLLSLHVKNFAIIHEVWVDFGSGLNVLTGETGAGKSILLGALNMALGGRVSREMLGKTADFCLAELVFTGEDETVREILREHDLPIEENLIITRKVMENGRSLSRVNGEAVGASVLKEISTRLIDIHGQHEHQSLLYPAAHLSMLDRYARAEEQSLPEDVREAYGRYRDAKKLLSEATVDDEERNRRIAMLRYEIDELTAANLREGEDTELEERFRILQNANRILEGVAAASEFLSSGRDNAEDLISRAEQRLSKVESLDPKLSKLYSELGLVSESLTGLSEELRDYGEELRENEEEFSEVSERLDVLNKIKSRYGKTVGMALSYLEQAETELSELEHYEEYRAKLEASAEKEKKTLVTLSGKLARIRKSAAEALSEEIRSSLSELNFPGVKFEIRLTELSEPNENGAETAEFYIATNPGEPLRPLAKIASGGEMSRVMLALKSVYAGKDDIGTLIFDEIDTGVSGRTAQLVAEKMALIGLTRQIICITHLPQIASMGDCHFRIEKTSDDTSTESGILRLSEEERVEELSRILGGAAITASVTESAKEMLALAKDRKSVMREQKHA